VAKHHQVALGREAGNLEPHAAHDLELRRGRGQFLLVQATLQGQPRTAGRQQVSAQCQHVAKAGERTRGDAVEGAADRLHALFGNRRVGKAQLAHGGAQEARLLAVGIHQRHAPAGRGDGQRNAGQAGAAAEVGKGFAGNVRQDGERIEQVAGDHFRRIAYRAQVVGGVPARQQGHVGQQAVGCGIVQREFEGGKAGAQALPQRIAVGHGGRSGAGRAVSVRAAAKATA
jgi:hypothetical protein